MTPLRLSNVWQRRFFVAVALVSGSVAIAYALSFFGVIVLAETLVPPIEVGIAMGAIAITAIILAVLSKKITGAAASLVVYLIFSVSVGWLVMQTGDLTSPYLALWLIVAFFGGMFGVLGWIIILAINAAFIALSYISSDLTPSLLAGIAITSVIPFIAGIIVWREHTGENDESTRNVKTLANQLSEVASKSEIVINAIGDGVIVVDPKGVISLINPAAQEILGWGKQDALMLSYKSILRLVNDDNGELDPSADPLQQALNTNQEIRSNKLTVITQSGKKISTALVVSPIGDMGSGVIVVFRDITNEKAEEREQAEFISTASHEMRTPVASIEGYLGLVSNPNTATIDARARDYVTKAHEAAQHLGRLFQDLLDVSKSEDGRMNNIPKVVDIVTYVDAIAQGLQQKAQEKGLQLNFKPTDAGSQKRIMPVYYVNQDNDHIREVVNNLIENAIKYTPKGSVTVDVTGTEDKVIISVQDTGLGIPAEDISHLFQKFYRVENIDRQEIGGTGLGLYLSRRLAESMQGRLWVESVFGQGSTFFVELPRIDSQEAGRLKEQQDSAAQTAATNAASPTFIPEVSALSATMQQAPAVTSIPVTVAAPQPPAPAPTTQIQVTTPVVEAVAPAVIPEQPAVAAQPIATQVQPVAIPQPETAARPATTVPRGELLTSAQKAERVRMLEAMAKQQREQPIARPPA